MSNLNIIMHNQYPIVVLKMRYDELDKSKLSKGMLSLKVSDDKDFLIRCNKNGNILIGTDGLYTIYDMPKKGFTKEQNKINELINSGYTINIKHKTPNSDFILSLQKDDELLEVEFPSYNVVKKQLN